MESLVGNLLSVVLSGGPHAISACLFLFIIMLLFDRKRLLDTIAKKDARIDGVVTDYYKGNLTLAEAMTSLKNVLFELKMKI